MIQRLESESLTDPDELAWSYVIERFVDPTGQNLCNLFSDMESSDAHDADMMLILGPVKACRSDEMTVAHLWLIGCAINRLGFGRLSPQGQITYF